MEEWAERKLPVFSYPFFMSFVRVRSAREDNMKKAILTVSFGTSHLDTLEKTIGAIERGACGSISGPDALPGVYKRHGHRKIKVGP